MADGGADGRPAALLRRQNVTRATLVDPNPPRARLSTPPSPVEADVLLAPEHLVFWNRDLEPEPHPWPTQPHPRRELRAPADC